MKKITKKRLYASFIDGAVASGVSLTLEYFLKKKIKNEAFYQVVLPYITQYTLETIQLKQTGQTIGYRCMGLKLENEDGQPLTTEQIIKRMTYRDLFSTIKYFKDREAFNQQDGAIFPHDAATGVIIKSINP